MQNFAKRVAYNVIGEKTTRGIMKALADMYEKSYAANKVYSIGKWSI